MKTTPLTRSLILVAAGVALAAGAEFVGYLLGGSTAADERLAAKISERVDHQLDARLNGEQFGKRIRAEIEAYVSEQRSGASRSAAKSVPPVRADDHVRGNPDAQISLVEYSDYECPYCKRFHGTVSKLIERYDGRVNWVFRHFPLPMHEPAATRAAEATECAADLAGNDAFWRLTDAIFEQTRSNGRGVPGGLAALASDLGIDRAALEECLDSERMTDRVERDLQEGQEAGVRGTPGSFLIDRATGRVVSINGARPLEQLTAAVDRLTTEDAP